VKTPFFISPAYCVPRMTISLCFKLMSMLVELVMKLLYCTTDSKYMAVNSDNSSTDQVRLMSMLVELVMKLLYCRPKSSTKAVDNHKRQYRSGQAVVSAGGACHEVVVLQTNKEYKRQ
jgi:hypothetical protein